MTFQSSTQGPRGVGTAHLPYFPFLDHFRLLFKDQLVVLEVKLNLIRVERTKVGKLDAPFSEVGLEPPLPKSPSPFQLRVRLVHPWPLYESSTGKGISFTKLSDSKASSTFGNVFSSSQVKYDCNVSLGQMGSFNFFCYNSNF
jgi:hypothetical protein